VARPATRPSARTEAQHDVPHPPHRPGSARRHPLAAAWAQTNAPAPGAPGVTLGWTAQIDATVLDVPPEAVDVTRVAASSADDVDIALLARERDSAGGPQLRGTLPDLRGSPLLQPITSERLWTCAMRGSADARFAPVTLWAVGAPAVLELVNAPLPDEPAPGYRQLLLLFADTDVRVQGSCPEAPTSLQVDLHLRPGWNLVTSELLTPGDGGTILLRASAAAELDGVAWRWRDTRAPGHLEVVPRRE